MMACGRRVLSGAGLRHRGRLTGESAGCLPLPAPLHRPLFTLLRTAILATTFLTSGFAGARADVFPRVSEAEGTVVARKTGEEAQFVDVPAWQPVDVNQGLLAGDTLRTNATGNLTIRFADKSLVRMGRNTTMLVKKISNVTDSVLGLTEGAIWARAARGGSKVQVDTPAATAAIRGTDWTLRVSGKQTTLTVLEGSVELSNAQGSVVVNQGEGATVTIGQAPRKYTLVNLKEREQMLLYNQLRDVFGAMSPSGMDGTRSRAERRRILAADAGSRSAEDWLSLAETSLSISGRKDAREALSHLKRPLKGSLEARAKLVEAMLAGQEMHYAKAAGLFAEALPGVPRDRKATAAYGLWFARSLAEPTRAFPPPNAAAYADDPTAALAQADATAYLKGQAEAIEVIRAAENRFPDDARLPAARASLALQLDRRDEVSEALARAKAIDPDDPGHLLTSAQFKTMVSSDVDGALAELQHAVVVTPGDSAIWNEIALVQLERNAMIEADRAHRKAVELDPENPAIRANYARFLLDNEQVVAAKHQIDLATALDPNSYAVLATRGRYLLKIGKTAEGEKVLLDAAAVNPTYGDALIGLAIATYQQNAPEETMQALDNADRFDPNNPSISLIRSGIAVDQYQADEAIIQAREALRRRQLRGGYYSGYDVNRQAASYLGVTLGNLGMAEWEQYYADRSVDPFKATTYVEETAAGRLSPFVNPTITGLDRSTDGTTTAASELQGFLMDPLSVASEARKNTLERRSFFEGALTGSLLQERMRPGWATDVSLQGTSYAGLPVSYAIQGQIERPEGERANDADDFDTGRIQLGLRPTLSDSLVLFGSKIYREQEFPGQLFEPTLFDQTKTTEETIGGAWSHVLGERNVIQAFAVWNQVDTRDWRRLRNDNGVWLDHDMVSDQSSLTGGFSHVYGIGPFTLRYGLEATKLESGSHERVINVGNGYMIRENWASTDELGTRSYFDTTWDVNQDLQFHGGVHWVQFDGHSAKWGPLDFRFGGAWSPLDGHWLRAYYRQDTTFLSIYTLSPISTVGLSPLELPQFIEGQTQTSAVRWDAEWSDRFFTAIEYQHQRFNGLGLPYDEFAGSAFTSEGVIDRLNISVNYWIGGGLGSFASLTLNESRDTAGFWAGNDVPLIPDYVAQVGLKYVHPSRVTVAVAQNFVGQRLGAQATREEDGVFYPVVADLEKYTTTDAAITWSSPNGNLDFNLAVTNIFDERFESALGIPAPGRTIFASLTTRF
jgi:Tfp pilus assembly protein PilF